jgi:type III pantothenate kinase
MRLAGYDAPAAARKPGPRSRFTLAPQGIPGVYQCMLTKRPREAEFLLIDIGNTHVKLRLASPEALLGTTRRLPTARLLNPGVGADALVRVVERWKFRRAVLSSVVPAATRLATHVLGAAQILRVQQRLEIGVDLSSYPGRKTLGADRLANMAGAMALYGPGPLIVAGFGTAAVFNVVDARGRFLGGVIAPGLAAIHASLPARTAQLPLFRNLKAPARAIGRTTRESLAAGTVLGYRGLVREILATLQAKSGPARVIATGGDAAFLAAQTGLFDVVAPDLTLEGLRVIATYKEKRL